MTWLTTNAFPVGWHNFPLFQWLDRPQWFVTNTNTYAPGGVPNPYALAVTGGPGVAERAAVLCTNRWTSAGETVTFKLYVPGTGGFFTVKNAVTGSNLSTSGFSATVGWKDISITVPAGDTAIQIELEDPKFSNGVYPKYVLDEVASASVKDGGLSVAFPPAQNMPAGWATSGTRTFAPAIVQNESESAATFGSYGALQTTLLGAGETANLLSPDIVVGAGGITAQAYVSLAFVSGSAPDAIVRMYRCNSAGAEIEELSNRAYGTGPGWHNLPFPEGTWKLKFAATLSNATQVRISIDAISPESSWQTAAAPPWVPPVITGWLATAAFPKAWFNRPVEDGPLFAPQPEKPQWVVYGDAPGPYALAVQGGAGVTTADKAACLLTNRFSVPSGGATLAFEMYVSYPAGDGTYSVQIFNRAVSGNVSYSFSGAAPDWFSSGWKTVTLILPEGPNCIEIVVQRNDWESEEALYIVDEVASSYIVNGGDGVAFPPGHAIPPGWASTGVVPWVLSGEGSIGSGVLGSLCVYTGPTGLVVAPGGYAEFRSNLVTVAGSPLSASCYVKEEFASSAMGATFSVLLCDEAGATVSTLYSQALPEFTWVNPTFSIPVGTWILRFRVTGNFAAPQAAVYLDALAPDVLMQGGDAPPPVDVVFSIESAGTASDDMTLSGIILAAMQSVATGASVSHLGPLVPVTFNSRAVLASTLSAQILRVMWASSTATGASSFDVQTEVAMVLQSLIVGQSHWPFPAENVAVWAVNAETGATTRYEGFDFNSYAKIGDSYFGCKADGIYQLDGDTDAGEPIRAMVSFGKQDFGTSALKRITNAYVGVSGQGRLFLKIMAEGQEYTYAARSYDENIQVQRFDTGKGLRVNWLEFELYNADGEDFELASVEFAVVPTSRRI